jgi:hypothetical protein
VYVCMKLKEGKIEGGRGVYHIMLYRIISNPVKSYSP